VVYLAAAALGGDSSFPLTCRLGRIREIGETATAGTTCRPAIISALSLHETDRIRVD